MDDEELGASPKQEVEDSNKEPSILSDFSACMYEYEDEATFEETFNILRSKASKQTWLDSVGAESDQHVNICSFVVRCDRMWPSTQ